jgi:hypothetical protein
MVLGSLTEGGCVSFAYGTIAFYGPPFQVIRLESNFVTPRSSPQSDQVRSHDTVRATLAGFNARFGLSCFPFARRYLGNRGFFLFLGVLRCFSSPR